MEYQVKLWWHQTWPHKKQWLENGNLKGLSKEIRHGRTAHNMSSSSLRKKSDLVLVSRVRFVILRQLLANLQEVILGTKLSVLFPAIPLAIVADCYGFGRPWVFGLSLLGLTPLAERVSFLTEPPFIEVIFPCIFGFTVGGLLNATCGNATELIIAVLALSRKKIGVVKYSLLGSILSNLLLVLGTSLFCGGLANLKNEQKYDRKQADVNSLMLLLALLCHMLPMTFRYAASSSALAAVPTLQLSRASSIIMLLAYFAYLIFQLFTHRQLFEAQEEADDDSDVISEEVPVIGFWSGFAWLIGMTAVIALLSEYVVSTIEDASDSWGISVSFISIILLPIVGNAAEHAGAIIFAFKNKLDISLGVALGSATQIAMFVVPLCVIVAWIMGINMDLDFNLLETGSLTLSIIVTSFRFTALFTFARTAIANHSNTSLITSILSFDHTIQISSTWELNPQTKESSELKTYCDGNGPGQEADEDSDVISEEVPVIGFWIGFAWLVGMTAVIALLSQYIVGTIEVSCIGFLGISVSFISIILLPIVGNAAEHAGAIILAFKNKLDISLGVALGSATQIAMFVVPSSVIMAWIMGINMDLDFNRLKTGSLTLSIIVTAFTLQDGTSHYVKGLRWKFIGLDAFVILSSGFELAGCKAPRFLSSKLDDEEKGYSIYGHKRRWTDSQRSKNHSATPIHATNTNETEPKQPNTKRNSLGNKKIDINRAKRTSNLTELNRISNKQNCNLQRKLNEFQTQVHARR
ncbi:hypothetical protein L1049_007469 [Liquidambar formosana]|uniref:Sodium/calcium exchanger membrane region domain-containing protein n=1 Tax=Liquidambar formosana TaxID=63359 RepID=A0AAP0X1H9_LIQFO